jgi:hypothetical protein
VKAGDVKVSGTVYESLEGSGVNKVEVYFNGGKIPDSEVQLSANKDYFEWHFTAEGSGNFWADILDSIRSLAVVPQVFEYDLEVRAYDYAGNMGDADVTIQTSKAKNINTILLDLLILLIIFHYLTK